MQLVADIGGTNSRIARLGVSGRLQDLASYKNAGFNGLSEIIDAYLDQSPRGASIDMVVAIAGPVVDNVGRMTNLPWVIDGADMARRLGGRVQVINDLTAMGHAALDLDPDQLIEVCPGASGNGPTRQALVVGIGTGFNVSSVIDTPDRTICPVAEAGHVSLPSRVTQTLDALIPGLSRAFDTVESLFSGQGRRRFLSSMTGRKISAVTPAIAALGTPENADCDAALDTYAMLIGHLARDLKLAYMPNAGLFLAGGVARSSLVAHRANLCRDVFEAPDGLLSSRCAIRIINDDAAALKGCSKFARAAVAA